MGKDIQSSVLIKAKFHYASWFEAGSKLIMEFGREPASSCQFAASKLDDRPNFSSNQLRTSFEPASVMEFDFNWTMH